MKKRNILFTKLASLFAACILVGSCTNLDVFPYNQLTAYNFYNNRLEVLSAVLRPYTHAAAWARPSGQGSAWRANELSADQLIWPQKGPHGFDGGNWGRLHHRTWEHTMNDPPVWDPWRLAWWGVGFINNTLHDFATVVDWERIGVSPEERAAFEGDLRAQRAWHHLKMMELYGNIPIVTQVGGVDGATIHPANLPQAEVFAWIEQELLDMAPDLPPISRQLHGRMSRAAVYAMLVELYLNAEVWTGTPRWDRVIYFSNRIMSGAAGDVALDPDNLVTFSSTNSARSTEGLFQIAFDRRQGMWLGLSELGSTRDNVLLNMDVGNNHGWNGIVLTPNAFHAYSPNDLRRQNWFLFGIGNHRFQGPFPNISTAGLMPNWDFFLGQNEFTNLPIIFAYKPIKAYFTVSGTPHTTAGRYITITEWHSPEFPYEYQKLLVQEALNGNTTRQLLFARYDGSAPGVTPVVSPANYVYLSGSLDPHSSGAGYYSWTNRSDYLYIWDNAAENVGARLVKYYIGPRTDPNQGGNHWMVYRLSWIYFAKAEALMRQNGGVATQQAVDLINAVKQRAFEPADWPNYMFTTATLTLETLLEERGREFIMEGWRRQDLIRFDVWEFGLPGWWDSPATVHRSPVNTGRHTRLFPIPYNAMRANPNLVQNPGYN